MPLADAQYCALSFWNGFKCAPSIAQWPLSQPASPTPQLSPTWWAKASPVRSCRPWWRHPSKNTFYLHRLVISFHSKVYCYNVNMCIHVLYTNVLGLGAASVDFSSVLHHCCLSTAAAWAPTKKTAILVTAEETPPLRRSNVLHLASSSQIICTSIYYILYACSKQMHRLQRFFLFSNVSAA